MAKLKRKQLNITKEQDSKLKEEVIKAKAEGRIISESHVTRDALQFYFSNKGK